MMYPGFGLATRIGWTLLINFFALTGGWLITVAFYRANKGGKIALALLPVSLSLLMSLCQYIFGDAFVDWMGRSFMLLTGLMDNQPGNGMLTMAVGSLLCLGVTWLLTRRAAVK